MTIFLFLIRDAYPTWIEFSLKIFLQKGENNASAFQHSLLNFAKICSTWSSTSIFFGGAIESSKILWIDNSQIN